MRRGGKVETIHLLLAMLGGSILAYVIYRSFISGRTKADKKPHSPSFTLKIEAD